jgi:hypothetical protein
MKISKKNATAIALLIRDMDMASGAISRQCAKDRPDSKALNFWMADHDRSVLKLREVLGVKIQDTYEELRDALSEQLAECN